MGKIIVMTNLSLDGVMQAPGRPDEDTRNSFKHGGWATPYAGMSQAGEAFANMGGFLFGRRTYEDFYGFWSKQTDGNPMTEALNNTPKYVVSTKLKEPLEWQNSTLLKGDAAKTITALKEQQDKDFIIFGSGKLINSLMGTGVIDEYVLLFHPLILGSGRRLFADGAEFASLNLSNSKTTETGVVIATYKAVK
jgi:dihydrofolate reductase